MAYVDIQCPAKALVDSGWPEETSDSTAKCVEKLDEDESNASYLKVAFRGKPRLRQRPVQDRDSRPRPRSSPVPLSASPAGRTAPSAPTQSTNSDKSVTFKFREMLESEKPGLATLFPVTWQPGMKEYLIISDPEDDSEDSDSNNSKMLEENPETNRRNSKSSGKPEKTNSRSSRLESSNHDNNNGDLVPSNSDTEDESDLKEEVNLNETAKHDRSLKSKLSVLTKDIGNLFSGPSHNLREFLRRREGYQPPEQSSRLARRRVEDHS